MIIRFLPAETDAVARVMDGGPPALLKPGGIPGIPFLSGKEQGTGLQLRLRVGCEDEPFSRGALPQA